AAHYYDANISIPGCDKNMPGTIMAMARLNRPSLMIYGGTIRAGSAPKIGRPVLDIIAAYESYGELAYGKISLEERNEVVRQCCPG
ncbi:MAG: dihydroxy-acid dehydratase, partial [Promethearchaeia archaeon]